MPCWRCAHATCPSSSVSIKLCWKPATRKTYVMNRLWGPSLGRKHEMKNRRKRGKERLHWEPNKACATRPLWQCTAVLMFKFCFFAFWFWCCCCWVYLFFFKVLFFKTQKEHFQRGEESTCHVQQRGPGTWTGVSPKAAQCPKASPPPQVPAG